MKGFAIGIDSDTVFGSRFGCRFGLQHLRQTKTFAAREKPVVTAKCRPPSRPFDPVSALSSVVEHFLHTEGVAGSNPAARTIFSFNNVGKNPKSSKRVF